ncbi:GNAT family N-acetyltransferase [Ornithinibacillus sp. L9]|uniref:Aminoglycoside N(6')-acetyltransferase type 1 n=1 Tax=Ornithinibacillus caprae TaxID=2678566 RepID=A0A6N8FPE2_9BACI|nr:aminoglycoside 6'-N-acetyltransferase [Ornithinibacillus caprae]MUK89348.1 GNAT family N-acetyltransferase [Ornithinibacillus caprae]
MAEIMAATRNQVDEVTNLAMDLWSGHDYNELRKEFMECMESDKNHVLLYYEKDKAVAFMYVSIRTDYVEGSTSSPTGYIEGIYVKPAFRRKGISKKLFDVAKKWFIEKECKQVGSDIEFDNKVSYKLHKSIGFKEAGRLITFIQDLD